MDCNKDEAYRSREIAERKFLQHEFVEAKKFALKAQRLFPELEGLRQLMAVLDVHIIAEAKFDGVEPNWYGILQTDPAADDATIRRQYRKLALSLHPDKNKAVGSDGAFKIILEAWGVLSDKQKKAAYDARRKTTRCGVASASHDTSSRYTYSSSARRAHRKSPTFWTACPCCKLQYEFQRIHENKTLFCHACSTIYIAIEIPGPYSSKPTKHTGENTSQTSSKHTAKKTSRNPVEQNGTKAGSGNPTKQRKGGVRGDSHPSCGASSEMENLRSKHIDPGHKPDVYGSQRNACPIASANVKMSESTKMDSLKKKQEAREKFMKMWAEAQKATKRKGQNQAEAQKSPQSSPMDAEKESQREHKQKSRQEEMAKRERNAAHAKKAFDKLFRSLNVPVGSQEGMYKANGAVDVQASNKATKCSLEHQISDHVSRYDGQMPKRAKLKV